MKKKNAITITITTASALLLAVGCAHEEKSVRTDDSYYSTGRLSEYNQNNYTTPAVGGSYSADGSYSSGGGGYSATPPKAGGNYSGTVGADGTYTPNTPAETSSTGIAYSGGAQSDSLLVQQVNESLRQDPEIAVIAPNIQVSVNNGAVVLNGHCQSEEQKRQILARVQKVTGVATVNNQLTVMAGPNGQNSNGLTPTGNSDSSQSLYRDAAHGQDISTNNALNSTSRQNGQPQLYQESTNSNSGALNPTSRQNENSQLYQNGSGAVTNQNQNMHNGQNQNTNDMQNGVLNPTSRPNGSSQMYQNQNNSGLNSTDQNVNSRQSTAQQNGQNQSTNNLQSTDTLSPTSRQNGTNSIYQNNAGEKSQDTNNVQRTP